MGCQLADDNLMEVSLWCINTTFKNGEKGTKKQSRARHAEGVHGG